MRSIVKMAVLTASFTACAPALLAQQTENKPAVDQSQSAEAIMCDIERIEPGFKGFMVISGKNPQANNIPQDFSLSGQESLEAIQSMLARSDDDTKATAAKLITLFEQLKQAIADENGQEHSASTDCMGQLALS